MEIKANGLRLGNFVNWNNCISEIKEIFLNNDEYIFGLKYEMPNNQFDNKTTRDIQPIPLNEEWLLRFGFKRWGSFIDLWKVNRDTGRKITIRSNPLGKYAYKGHGCDFELSENYLVGIEYVHQLQNIYFALTGEELTIKN